MPLESTPSPSPLEELFCYLLFKGGRQLSYIRGPEGWPLLNHKSPDLIKRLGRAAVGGLSLHVTNTMLHSIPVQVDTQDILSPSIGMEEHLALPFFFRW